MTDNEKDAVALTVMAVALDAQSEHPAFTAAQTRLWTGGVRRPVHKREAHTLLPATDQETAQRVQTLLDQIAGELMDDDPDFGGFSDFDIVNSALDEARLRETIEEAIGTLEVDQVDCKFCERAVPAVTAHRHQDEWIGDECCWDERLRGSE